MRRRHPVAVYRVIDEAELLGESDRAGSSEAGSPLHDVGAGLLSSGDSFAAVWIFSVLAVAIAGALTLSPSVANRRRHGQTRSTPVRVPLIRARPVRHARPRRRVSTGGPEHQWRRRTKSFRSSETLNTASPKSVGVAARAPATASSNPASGRSVPQVAREFGFER
jgi:hypothetical protein